jgi:hypothetical protein
MLEKRARTSGKGVGFEWVWANARGLPGCIYLQALILINCILVGGEWKKVISVLPKLVYCTKLDRVEWSHASSISTANGRHMVDALHATSMDQLNTKMDLGTNRVPALLQDMHRRAPQALPAFSTAAAYANGHGRVTTSCMCTQSIDRRRMSYWGLRIAHGVIMQWA